MFGLSAGEIIFIALIALVLFGNDKLPENMKKLLRGWNQTRKVTTNLQNSWRDIKLDIKNSVDLGPEALRLEEPDVGSKPIAVAPVHAVVSQEEIDAHSQYTSLKEPSSK